ncbi:DUF1641 domain-containing protein [Nocardioides sp.]|uniref:DUF1641 domain-containing protein n=1 Tax=Nocardioides sp. TaxID=35761 RepID=UPI003D0ADDCA
MTLAPSREEAAQAQLSARLNDPAVAGALTSLLDHAELLAVLVEGLDGFVARTEVIGDNLAGSFSELRTTVQSNEAFADSGVDLQALADAGVSLAAVLPKAAPGMVAAVESGAIDKLFASGVIGPAAVDQVAILANGLVSGSDRFAQDPVQIGGPLSLLKLLKDPDINRAISYFATVAKAIGAEIAAAQPTSQK